MSTKLHVPSCLNVVNTDVKNRAELGLMSVCCNRLLGRLDAKAADGRSSLGERGSDLVGADDEHNAVHVGLRAHFLFHLPQPAIEGVETLPQADVINQQHPLTVLIELITHLTGRNNKKKKSRCRWKSFSWFNGTTRWQVPHMTIDSKLTSDTGWIL